MILKLRAHSALFVAVLLGIFVSDAPAQQSPNLTVQIPIRKDRRYYNYTTEDGKGRVCGVKLYGVWDVYKNYTNLSSYSYWKSALVGIQNPSSPTLVVDGQRKYFQVYCYFNGSAGPDGPNVDCNHTIGESLPDWQITLTRTPPQANFTTTFFPPTPGEVKFQATSIDPEDPDGNVLIHRWDFGDTSGGSGDIEIHRYTKPGRFNVKLTATNPDGLFGPATREVRIPAPRVLVSMQLLNKHSLNRIEPAEEFRVRVMVEASSDGVGSLTNLIFNGPPLFVPSIFNIVSAPPQTNISNLKPGEKQEFYWTLRTVGIGDFSLISASVVGRDEAGQSVFGAGATQRGEVTALIVGVEQQPKQVLLNRDNNGDGKTNSVDHLVNVIVSVTNVINRDITDVQTTQTNDPITLVTLASSPGINMIVTNTTPGIFGTIPSGESRSITNTYEAWGRVYAEAQSVVHGKVDGVPVQEAGKGTINVGGSKLVEARFGLQRDGTNLSGHAVRFYGKLTNVSLLKSRTGVVVDEGKTVGVMIYPQIAGNGVGGYMYKAGSSGATPRAPTGFLLKPNETIDIEGIVATSQAQTNTVMDIVFDVQGFVHGEGPEPRRALPYEIEVVEQTDDTGNRLFSGSYHVELAAVEAVTDPEELCPFDYEFYYSCRIGRGIRSFMGGVKDLVVIGGTGLFYEIPRATIRMAAYTVWLERQRIKALLGDEQARARVQAQIDADWLALKTIGLDTLNGIESIGPALDDALQKFDRDRREGGFKFWAGGTLELLAENPDMGVEAFLASRLSRKITEEGAEAVAEVAFRESLQRQTDQLAGEVAQFSNLPDLPTSGKLGLGLNVLKHPQVWRDAYGATEKELKALLEIARKEGVILTFRSRSARAAQLIEAGQALLKPHGVHIKTVNEIDRTFLGYLNEHEGLCVLVEPPIPALPPGAERNALMEAYLDRFPALRRETGGDAAEHLRGQVRERLETRLNEWPKESKKFLQYEQYGIDVGFKSHKQFGGNPAFNDVIVNKSNIRDARIHRSTLEPTVPGDSSRKVYVLEMEDAPGSARFLPITGDIDLIGMFNPDGTLPSLFKRLRLYKLLRRAGTQHGESFSYFIKDDRIKFLKCCTPGGENEVMLAVTPSGELLTTQYVDELSKIEGNVNGALRVGKGDDQFVFLAGVGGELFSKERTATDDFLSYFEDDVVYYASASTIARTTLELDAAIDRREGVQARIGPDGTPQIYVPPGTSNDPSTNSISSVRRPDLVGLAAPTLAEELKANYDAAVAAGYIPEAAPPGALGGYWRTATNDELRAGRPAGSGIRLAPYTYLEEDVPAGETVLPILRQDELGNSASSQFFAVGDMVIIDPGDSEEEIATVIAALPGELRLSKPLHSAKQIGTSILFLSGVEDSSALPRGLPSPENVLVWLKADAGVELSPTNVLSWTDQSPNGFIFASRSEAARPSLITDTASGLTALRFDAAQRDQLYGNLETTLSNATIFTLMRMPSQSSTRYAYSFGTRNTSGYMMSMGRRSGDVAFHYDGAAEGAGPGTWADTNFVVLSQVYGGSGPDHHKLDLNRRTVIDSRTTTGRPYLAVATNVIIGNYLSATFNFSGDLVEWIVYDRTLNETEKSQVEEYLRARAGLPPFPAATNVMLSSVPFSLGSTNRQTALWTFDSVTDISRAQGGFAPSINLLDQAFAGEEIHTRLTATGTNGAIGLVLGYEDRGSFYLLEWRALSATNFIGRVAPAGLRLLQFHTPAEVEAPAFNDFYTSTSTANVTILGTNELTWIPDRTYDLSVHSSAGGLFIEVFNGATNLLTWLLPGWTAPIGWFGHYSHGVQAAEFGPVTITEASIDEPIQLSITRGSANGEWTIRWDGGHGPFHLEWTSDLGSGVWQAVGAADNDPSRTISAEGRGGFFRVRQIASP